MMREQYNARLGGLVRKARREAGLSQTALGMRLDPPISYAAISDIERGQTNITAWHVHQIAAATGWPLWRFMANPFDVVDHEETAW